MFERLVNCAGRYSFNNQDLLVLATCFTWLFFPVMIKPHYPTTFITLFGVLMGGVIIRFYRVKPKKIITSKYSLILFLSYCSYLVSLVISSIMSGSLGSLAQSSVAVVKFLFFIILLLFMKREYIVKTLNVYAYFTLTVCILALLSFVYIEFGGQPLATLELNLMPTDLYLGAYATHHVPPLFFKASRLQGLADEPGTLAFSILPAFFWFLFVKRSKLAVLVLVFSMVVSMALGIVVTLIGLVFFTAKRFGCKSKEVIIILMAAFSIICLYFVTTSIASEFSTDGQMYSMSTTLTGKVHSFNDRFSGISAGISSVIVEPFAKGRIASQMFGSGAGLGIARFEQKIALIGYLVPLVDAGILGSLFYLVTIGMIGWLVLIKLIAIDKDTLINRQDLTIVFSVATILVMGLVRMGPDNSFWHFWLLAIFFSTILDSKKMVDVK